jgi:TnpA family transposase
MPAQFLSPEQIAQYGCYAGEPSSKQLVKYFHLDDADLAVMAPWREDHTRLGFAVQLCTVRFLGNFLSDWIDTPLVVREHLARQLQVENLASWQDLYVGSRTQKRHRHFIREHYGYEEFHHSRKVFTLLRRLYARAWLAEERPLVLFDFATTWLVQHKVLLPGATVLERLVARVINRTNERLWRLLAQLPDEIQARNLLNLLKIEEGTRISKLEWLRREERRATSRTIVSAIRRLQTIRTIGVSHIDLSALPIGRINAMARYGLLAWAQTIENLDEKRRLATLVALTKELEALVQDEVLDLFVKIIIKDFNDAEKEGLQARLNVIRQFDAAALHLREACLFLFDDNLPDNQLRQAIFSRIPREQLLEATDLVGQESARHAPHYYNHLSNHYRSVRLFLLRFLESIDFAGMPAGRFVLNAWQFLYQLDYARPAPDLQDAPQDVVDSTAWRAVVFMQEKLIDRRYYTFCVLHQLVGALQRRDVFVSPSRKWQDQRLQLLHGDAWRTMRPQICLALGRTTNGDEEMSKLTKQLDRQYRRVAKRFKENKGVTIKKDGKYDRIQVRRQKKLHRGERLNKLQEAVYSLLPQIDLPELLLEINALTQFADEFTHISEDRSWVEDLPLSICAVLMAEACNIGVNAVTKPDIPALEQDRLLWVQQNYIRNETLTQANARLVAAQAELPLAQLWGSGDVASADGLRFRVAVDMLAAEYNWKYFGEGKGITLFTFSSDQFTEFYGIIIPGAVREALYILDGLLEQQTVLEPVEIMTDTAGYTDIVFGLFWLLGYQFSPRLRDIGKTRFWRVNRKARYGALNNIARHKINTNRIVENWDDLLRVAGSLKLGKISASDLMRTLQASKNSSALAKAITEVGRIAKTMYLLNYIDDADYRRRIMIQLLRGERRHRLARTVFHGNKGEARKKYQEGLEDQMGALGLVVNMIVLWNTMYMNKAIDHLRATGMEVRDEDIKRLTPLGFEHIRFLGRYDFTLKARTEVGGLRPLRRKRTL